ncbi:MAG: polyphosphate kinase 1, partial [Gemmatimonadetes bacterium]|nr:polyphosphate kinase 1 [Gemmatimonadota bacterium]
RFLYDASAPWAIVEELRERLGLEEDDLVAGGRYHNLNDLSAFPDFGRTDLRPPPRAPVPHPTLLERIDDPWTTLEARDHLLHFPYHAFQPVVDVLGAAAGDVHVEEVWIALYRVSAGSPVALQLIEAARQGKRVTAFVEVKARFDESTNLEWAARMEEAGVRVLYSKPGIKVHSKLCLIVRRTDDGLRRYAYLSTGNFNEGTARFYTDLGLWTADPRLADEVHRVFRFLADEETDPDFEHLLVAPFRLRTELQRHVDREIRAARAGQTSGITLKLNSLEDPEMVERLYDAAAAGVPVRLIVRGICCLRPGVPGLSESIQARSIVGPFLEHARVYLFGNAGEPRLFVASADWMTRNLDRRVEVAFPVYDPEVAAHVHEWLESQWADTVRARIVDAEQTNAFVTGTGPRVDSQLDQYDVWTRASGMPGA